MEVQKLTEEIASNLQSGFKMSTVSHCVHELVLNSLDATTFDIAVRINLETLRIQVVDNGEGITKNNLKLIGERYVTNRCLSFNDYKKQTKFYGFRGESLASIRDCCKKLIIMTRSANDPNTYCKTLGDTNNDEITIIEHRPSIGTTITIEDFFYNLPVRQRIIDVDVELISIKNLLENLSVIRPTVSFTLRNDINKVMIYKNIKVDTVEKAIMNLKPQVDPKFIKYLKVQKNKISVTCLLYKKMINSNIQYIHVNKRPVECNQLHKIIKYHLTKSNFDKESIKRDNKFLYVLNINCPYIYLDLVPSGNKYTVDFKNWEIVVKCVEKLLQKLLAQEEKVKISNKEDRTSPMPFKVKLSGLNGTCKYIAKKRKRHNVNDDNENEIVKDKTQTKSVDTLTKKQVAEILKRTKNDDTNKKCKKRKTAEKKLTLKPSHRKRAVKKILTTDYKINKKNFHNIFGKNGTFTTSSKEIECDQVIMEIPPDHTENNNLNDNNNEQINPYDFGKSSQNVNNQTFGKMIIMDKFLKSILRTKNDPFECDTRKSAVSFSVRIKSKKTVKHLKNKKQTSVSNVSVAQMISKRNYSDHISFTEEKHELELNFENQIGKSPDGFNKIFNENDLTLKFPSNITEYASVFNNNNKHFDDFIRTEREYENEIKINNNVEGTDCWPHNPITGKRLIDLCFESVEQPIFDINKNHNSFHIQTHQLSIHNNDDCVVNETLHFSHFGRSEFSNFMNIEDEFNTSMLGNMGIRGRSIIGNGRNEKSCNRRKVDFKSFESEYNKQLQNDFRKEKHGCMDVRKYTDFRVPQEPKEESNEGFEILKIGFDLNNDDFIDNRRSLLNTDKHFSSHILKERTNHTKTKRYHREIVNDDDFEPVKFTKRCRVPNYQRDFPRSRAVTNLPKLTKIDTIFPLAEFKMPEIPKKFKKVRTRQTNINSMNFSRKKDTKDLFIREIRSTMKQRKAENCVFPKPILKQRPNKDNYCMKQRLQETAVKDYVYPNIFAYEDILPFTEKYDAENNKEHFQRIHCINENYDKPSKATFPPKKADTIKRVFKDPNDIFTYDNDRYLSRKLNKENCTYRVNENDGKYSSFYNQRKLEKEMKHHNICGYEDIRPLREYNEESIINEIQHTKCPLPQVGKPETVVKDYGYSKMTNEMKNCNREAFSLHLNENYAEFSLCFGTKPEAALKGQDNPLPRVGKPETVVMDYGYSKLTGFETDFKNRTKEAFSLNLNENYAEFPSCFGNKPEGHDNSNISTYANDKHLFNKCNKRSNEVFPCQANENYKMHHSVNKKPETILKDYEYPNTPNHHFLRKTKREDANKNDVNLKPLKRKPETVYTFEENQLGRSNNEEKYQYYLNENGENVHSIFPSPHKRKPETVTKDYEDTNFCMFEDKELKKRKNESNETYRYFHNHDTRSFLCREQKPEEYEDANYGAFVDNQLRSHNEENLKYFQTHETNSPCKQKPKTVVKECDVQLKKHKKQNNDETFRSHQCSKFPISNVTNQNNENIDDKPKRINKEKLKLKNNKSKIVQTGKSLNKEYVKEVALQTSPGFFREDIKVNDIPDSNINDISSETSPNVNYKSVNKSYDLFSEIELNEKKIIETEIKEKDFDFNESNSHDEFLSARNDEESTNADGVKGKQDNEISKFTILSDIIINPIQKDTEDSEFINISNETYKKANEKNNPQKDTVGTEFINISNERYKKANKKNNPQKDTVDSKFINIANEAHKKMIERHNQQEESVLNETDESKIDYDSRNSENRVICEHEQNCYKVIDIQKQISESSKHKNENVQNLESDSLNSTLESVKEKMQTENINPPNSDGLIKRLKSGHEDIDTQKQSSKNKKVQYAESNSIKTTLERVKENMQTENINPPNSDQLIKRFKSGHEDIDNQKQISKNIKVQYLESDSLNINSKSVKEKMQTENINPPISVELIKILESSHEDNRKQSSKNKKVQYSESNFIKSTLERVKEKNMNPPNPNKLIKSPKLNETDEIIVDKQSLANNNDKNISVIEIMSDTESVQKDAVETKKASQILVTWEDKIQNDLISPYFNNNNIPTEQKQLPSFNCQENVTNAEVNIAQSKTSLYEDPTFIIPDSIDIFISDKCIKNVTPCNNENEEKKVSIKTDRDDQIDNNVEIKDNGVTNEENSKETSIKQPWESNLHRLTDLLDDSICNLFNITTSNDQNVPEQQQKQNFKAELPQQSKTKTSFESKGCFFSRSSSHQDIFASSEENRDANNQMKITLDFEDFKDHFSKEYLHTSDLNIFETKLDEASNDNEEMNALNMTVDVENLQITSRENVTTETNAVTTVLKESNTFIFSKRLEDIPKGFSPILQINEPICASLSSSGKNKLYDALVENYQKDLDTIKWKNILGNRDIGAFFKAVNKTMMSSIDLPNLWKCGKLIAKPINTLKALTFNKNTFLDVCVIGQMDNKFIVVLAENKKLLLLFDQHAVHERIRVEKLSREYMIQNDNVNKFTSIALHPKIKVELNKEEINLLQKHQEICTNFGVKFTQINTNLEVIDGPTCLSNKVNKDKVKENIIALIDEILDMIQNNQCVIGNIPKVIQAAINSEACRGAIMFGDSLNITQCKELINDLSVCNLPFQCAHGRPTLTPIIHLRDTIEMDSRPNLHNLLI